MLAESDRPDKEQALRPDSTGGAWERPRLAANVRLVGELQGSGFTERQWLVERDGRYIQLTELLYRVAENADGQHNLAEIAAVVTAETEWVVTPELVEQIVARKLAPLNLVEAGERSTEPAATPSPSEDHRSALSIHHRARVVTPELLDPLTRALRPLFWTPLVVLFLLLALAAHVWVYLVHGIVGGVYDILMEPGLLLVIVPVIIVSGLFHELGHATALRYGGGRARGVGAGFYLIYPTFYTDVTDAYRLSRGARLRTDLGGIYFHLIFALGVIAAYLVTGSEFLLSIVALIDFDILYQLAPIVRLDGYWALSDLLGIPDLFSLSRRFAGQAVSGSARGPGLLKPKIAAAYGAYLIVTIPALLLVFYEILSSTPSAVYTLSGTLQTLAGEMMRAAREGAFAVAVGAAIEALVVLLMIVGIVSFLGYGAWGPLRGGWRWSQGRPVRRAAVVLGSGGALVLLTLFWLPWLPIQTSPVPEGTQHYQVTSRAHVNSPVIYAQSPPVGGNHWPVWQNCGFYGAPVRNENAVHSLEHGAVWITYRPDLSANQVAQLKKLVPSNHYLLVSPYPGLRAPIVLSAWSYQLAVSSATDPRVQQFLSSFEVGPQAPERGAPCTGGVGQPAG